MKKIKIIIINIIFFLLGLSIVAQPKSNVLLQGKVLEGTSGKSVGTSLYFINSKGKPAHCLSNSLDGSYMQTLPSGDVYYLVVKGYIPESNFSKFDFSANSKFQDITTDIHLKPFKTKTELFKFKLFEPNDSIIISKQFILLIKNFRNFNPAVKLNIIISSNDSWLENSKRKVEKRDKKGKVSYKTVRYPTKERLSDLLSARILSLRNELQNNEVNFKQEEFIKDLKIVPNSRKQKKKTKTDKSKQNTISTMDFDNVKVIIAK